jgi:hypothetical protein
VPTGSITDGNWNSFWIMTVMAVRMFGGHPVVIGFRSLRRMVAAP